MNFIRQNSNLSIHKKGKHGYQYLEIISRLHLFPIDALRYSFPIMMRFLLIISIALLTAQSVPGMSLADEEPQIPANASWGMTLEQVQHLTRLDRSETETLLHSYIIHSATQYEFVALWRNRPISFYIDKSIGLYAINIEMMPRSIRHTEATTDQELIDIEQYAPIRFAIIQKYGSPSGIAPNWDADEVSSLSHSNQAIHEELKKKIIQWGYARNWLIWEGTETRLALGEHSLWYASQMGLIKKQQRKRELVMEQEQSIDDELARRLDRQQELEAAVRRVPSRAAAFISFF